jgi:hypothetical protein
VIDSDGREEEESCLFFVCATWTKGRRSRRRSSWAYPGGSRGRWAPRLPFSAPGAALLFFDYATLLQSQSIDNSSFSSYYLRRRCRAGGSAVEQEAAAVNELLESLDKLLRKFLVHLGAVAPRDEREAAIAQDAPKLWGDRGDSHAVRGAK